MAERVSLSQTITDTGWMILVHLINADLQYYKLEEVAKHAMAAMCKTANIADAPESRSHLREALIEHGFCKAAMF